ncbi:MAG: chromosomal replication initiator protein DnaA [Candidatus Nealsonbacteria bacterium]|nr:chromosomal replication initiator protein DnaA [Candidatus Nealsonbacteria bacterium]
MSFCDKEIVPALHGALREAVGQNRFELWFGAHTRLQFDGRTLTLAVPNQFFLDWIRSNFRLQIETACRNTLGQCPALKFLVDATLEDTPTQPEPAQHDGEAEVDDGDQPVVARVGPATPPSQGTSKDPAPDPPRRRLASLSRFVAGTVNRLPLASAETVAQRPGEMSPLLFHGPTAVGKTHLLEGILSAARNARRGITAVYLSAEQFTTYFLEALRGSGLPNFRRKYRNVELLIIDDLQFFAGKRATQIELLHTVDTILRQRRQLVLAADRPPSELAEFGPELTTRLQSGLVCPVEPPDYASRLQIVAQLAQQRNLCVPPDVQTFVASRLTSHARELSGALCRLQATSQALGQPIDLTMAEEALSEMVRHSGPAVRLPDIERAVCDVFGLESGTLHSGAKAKRVSHPRMLAMWLARKHTRAALSEIGQFFGRRSHSTVISAQRRVDGWMADGQTIRLADATWDVDDAIRRVERHLRAG